MRELLSIPTAEDEEIHDPKNDSNLDVDGADETDAAGTSTTNIEVPPSTDGQGSIDDSPSNAAYHQGIRVLAGIVACRMHAKHPELSAGGHITAIPAWVQHFAKKGAVEPKQDFFEQCQKMEKIFQDTHGVSVSFKFGLLEAFQKRAMQAHNKAPIASIKLYGWLRLCARLRNLNQRKNKNQDAVLSVNIASKVDKNTRAARCRKNWAK